LFSISVIVHRVYRETRPFFFSGACMAGGRPSDPDVEQSASRCHIIFILFIIDIAHEVQKLSE